MECIHMLINDKSVSCSLGLTQCSLKCPNYMTHYDDIKLIITSINNKVKG
jgi:hypothetical protein